MKFFHILFIVLIIGLSFICISPLLQKSLWYYELRSYGYYVFNSAVLKVNNLLNTNSIKEDVIVCFGDSITNGQGIKKEYSYPHVLSSILQKEVRTVSQNGWTSLDGLKNIKGVLQSAPQVVVIQLGLNDLSRGFDKTVTNNIHRLIKLIRQNDESINIVIMQNKIINSIQLPNQNNIYFADLFPIFSQSDLYIDRNSMHPNANAHKLIATFISELINNNKLLSTEYSSKR